jgi:hypothetical protein
MAVAEAVADEIATNLEEVAEVTRRIAGRDVSFLFGGIALGAPIGFYFGYKWNKEKLKAEIYAEMEAEIERIREMYNAREVARVTRADKPTVNEIIEERGYSVNSNEEQERPLRAPVPVSPAPALTPPTEPKDKNANWNYTLELQRRSPDAPYVIHQDEFNNTETGYTQTTYTYYALDDVLVDTNERPVAHADVVVGQENLKFGHGTDDLDVVFVRNDKLELEMEICRVPRSYGEDVLGHDKDETS